MTKYITLYIYDSTDYIAFYPVKGLCVLSVGNLIFILKLKILKLPVRRIKFIHTILKTKNMSPNKQRTIMEEQFQKFKSLVLPNE